jgi:hypothetical protein
MMTVLQITVEAVKKARKFPIRQPTFGINVVEEIWPGKDIQTDEQLKDFIRKKTWVGYCALSS